MHYTFISKWQMCTLSRMYFNGSEIAYSILRKVTFCTKRLYVTEYWKTDQNVTFDQLHFIGPANSHTHALSMHHSIIGLS